MNGTLELAVEGISLDMFHRVTAAFDDVRRHAHVSLCCDYLCFPQGKRFFCQFEVLLVSFHFACLQLVLYFHVCSLWLTSLSIFVVLFVVCMRLLPVAYNLVNICCVVCGLYDTACCKPTNVWTFCSVILHLFTFDLVRLKIITRIIVYLKGHSGSAHYSTALRSPGIVFHFHHFNRSAKLFEGTCSSLLYTLQLAILVVLSFWNFALDVVVRPTSGMCRVA